MFGTRGFRWLVYALILAGMVAGTNAVAKPRLNAPRAPGEPQWAGKIWLRGRAKAMNQATPLLERPYRLFHVYGNMTRRHHYRDTIIPSRQDRRDAIQAFFHRRY
jgi:hypothetical protein